MIRRTMVVALTVAALALGQGPLYADVLDEDGPIPECGPGYPVCSDVTYTKCIEYETVTVTVGTKVVVEQVCSRQVISRVLRYWP